MSIEGNEDLAILVDQLIQEANELLHAIIEKTRTSDERSRTQQSRWTQRHRLNVLLEAARETREKLPTNTIVAPWFLAELKATLEVIHRWHRDPSWNEVEPSLVNPTHFTHTIAKLWIAEQLKSAGHIVQIIPRGENASPDLMVQAIGGTKDWICVECYQPRILHGGAEVSIKDLQKIVRESMKKAKRQLDKKNPGILAICGFNQPLEVSENLKRISVHRLAKTERPNLCGFSLVMLGTFCRRNAHVTQFIPTISLNFVPNPNYFGRVEIVSEISTADPNLIREPLTDVKTEDLVENEIPHMTTIDNVPSPELPAEKKTVCAGKVELLVIEKPAEASRVVFSFTDTEPKLIGEGNIDYVCGTCGATLVKHGWNQSIINIVVRCPSCQSYNEFPKTCEIDSQLVKTMGFKNGEYSLQGAVWLKRGICMMGLEGN